MRVVPRSREAQRSGATVSMEMGLTLWMKRWFIKCHPFCTHFGGIKQYECWEFSGIFLSALFGLEI